MTLIPPCRYDLCVSFYVQRINRKVNEMMYQMWCQVKAEDAIRAAEQYRLVKIANQTHQTKSRKWLGKIIGVLGLIKLF